ncbi:Caspase domain, partial [Geosmithia morbida]
MSWAFVSAMRKNPQQSYVQLLNSIRDELATKYTQKPQLSCSHPLGHGGQTRDLDGDEPDGYDEVIYPVDFRHNGHITDDEMHRIMVRPLQPGVRLTAIFDSCHSGTALDLPYIYSTQGVLKEPNLAKEAGQGLLGVLSSYSQGDLSGVANNILGFIKKATTGDEAHTRAIATKTSPADVVMLSGSKDDQTSPPQPTYSSYPPQQIPPQQILPPHPQQGYYSATPMQQPQYGYSPVPPPQQIPPTGHYAPVAPYQSPPHQQQPTSPYNQAPPVNGPPSNAAAAAAIVGNPHPHLPNPNAPPINGFAPAPGPSPVPGPGAVAAPPPSEPQHFGQGAPQSYAYRYSNCTGRRKALLIGINYFGQRGQLRGCINDVRNMTAYLAEHFGYRREDMVILTDDQQNQMSQPTKQNILRAMHWLVKGAQSNDSLFFHYS